ncbi:hypothetical protein ACFE04_012201 [Oxalis oulophora]
MDPINLIDEDDDEGFLSEIAAVEAKAQSESQSKRRKFNNNNNLSSQSIGDIKIKKEKEEVADGAYTAALRGGKSLQAFLEQQQKINMSSSNSNSSSYASSGFKTSAVSDSVDGSEPSRNCLCGGVCSVFTANTEKNRGRKFYRCAVRQENGGCGFFEWCDATTNTSLPNYTTGATQTYASKYVVPDLSSNSVVPDLPCGCGAGLCVVLTAKTEKNNGRQFYRCPADKENSCGFFKWCNESTTMAVTSPPPVRITDNSGPKTGSSCFKCGKEGHWARDCTVSSSVNSGSGTKSASPGTCYKCSLPGHWAKDCSSTQQMNRFEVLSS